MGEENKYTRNLDEDEFGRIFTKCRPLFIRVANSYIHDIAVAEDITDECFIRMWEKRDGIQTENYEAYAFRALVNRCLDYLKVQQARLRIQQDIHASGNRMQMYEISSLKSLNPDSLFADEIMELIKECVGRMPSVTRKVFIASRVQEKTYSEISEELGIPVRQVTSHIQFALKSLRTSLKDYLPSIVITMLLSVPGLISIVPGILKGEDGSLPSVTGRNSLISQSPPRTSGRDKKTKAA